MRRLKKTSLYLHCIILSIICQVLGISGAGSGTAFATAKPMNDGEYATIELVSDVNDFYFENFTADYYLSKATDGSSRLRVVETFDTIFPETDQNHGITRLIPFTNQNGRNLTMPNDQDLDIVIKHNGISEKPYKISPEDGYFKVYIGDPYEYVHGRQIYTLEYEFINVITSFDQDGTSWQELYWDTNGNDWPQYFASVTAKLHFVDEEIANNYTGDYTCYVGGFGEKGEDRCTVSQIEDGIEFRTYNLSGYENLTFDVSFDPGTFAKAKLIYDYRLIIIFGCELGLGIIVSIIAYKAWQAISGKYKYYRNLFVKPEYTPPVDYSIGEMAADHIRGVGLEGRAITAILINLTIMGKIEIIKTDEKKDQWKLRLKTSEIDEEGIIALKFMDPDINEFQAGTEIALKKHTSNNTIRTLNSDLAQIVHDNLRKKGLFEEYTDGKAKSQTKNPANILAGIAALWLFAGLITGIFIFVDIPSYYNLIGDWWLRIVIIGLWFVMFITIFMLSLTIDQYYKRTQKGLEVSRYLDGLREYIKLAEIERIKFLQSANKAELTHKNIVKLYEKLLPYAILFGYEDSWTKELARYYEYDDVGSPDWYRGAAGVFIASDFTKAIDDFNTSVFNHSLTSSSSSGFSGSSGGGFSGGGGGGGGGGGW